MLTRILCGGGVDIITIRIIRIGSFISKGPKQGDQYLAIETLQGIVDFIRIEIGIA